MPCFIPFRASLTISKESLRLTSFQNVILPSDCSEIRSSHSPVSNPSRSPLRLAKLQAPSCGLGGPAESALSALASPVGLNLTLTCRPWPHLSALASPVSLNLTLTCWPWPHLLPPLPAHCPPAGFPPAFGSLWQTAGCSPPPAPASSSGISQGTGDILLLQSQRGGAALPCKTS